MGEAKQERRLNAQKQKTLSSRELREALKAKFATQTYWVKRDLERELGGAVQKAELGRLLEELCDKVTVRGAHYGDYMLKASLRTGLPAPSAAGPSASGAVKRE